MHTSFFIGEPIESCSSDDSEALKTTHSLTAGAENHAINVLLRNRAEFKKRIRYCPAYYALLFQGSDLGEPP